MLGVNHTDAITVANNLAGSYKQTDNKLMAEQVYLECLKIVRMLWKEFVRRKINNNNPDKASSEKDSFEEQTSALTSSAIDPVILVTLATMTNLAMVYCSRGCFSQGRDLYEECKEMLQATLGHNHPKIMTLEGTFRSLLIDSKGDHRKDKIPETTFISYPDSPTARQKSDGMEKW